MVCGYSRWLSAVLIPSRRGRGPVRRVVAADRARWVRCRGRWCGTVRARSGGGVRASRTDRRVPGVSRGAGHQGDHLQAGRPGSQGPHRTLPRLSGALVSARPNVRAHRRISTPAGRLVGAGRTPGTRRVLGCAPGGSDRRRPAGDAGTAPVAPAVGWRHSTRLPRDHYVRLDSNDYSVHPGAVGRRVEVTADLDRVRVVLRRQARSPSMSGSGPGIRPSPTPSISRRPSCCAASTSTYYSGRARAQTWRTALRWRTTTQRSVSTRWAGWRDGDHQDQRPHEPRRVRGDRLI